MLPAVLLESTVPWAVANTKCKVSHLAVLTGLRQLGSCLRERRCGSIDRTGVVTEMVTQASVFSPHHARTALYDKALITVIPPLPVVTVVVMDGVHI